MRPYRDGPRVNVYVSEVCVSCVCVCVSSVESSSAVGSKSVQSSPVHGTERETRVREREREKASINEARDCGRSQVSLGAAVGCVCFVCFVWLAWPAARNDRLGPCPVARSAHYYYHPPSTNTQLLREQVCFVIHVQC